MLRTPFLIGLVAGFVCFSAGPISAAESSSPPRQITADSGIVFPVFEPAAARIPDAPAAPLLKAHNLPVGRAWAALSPEQRAMVDLMAADFFNSELSAEQRYRIVAQTARSYAAADTRRKQAMRRARRAIYRALSQAQRHKLYQSPEPSYLHLNERQKAPFRRHAMEMMGLKFDVNALAQHLRDSI